jgi:hypothetical protein
MIAAEMIQEKRTKISFSDRFAVAIEHVTRDRNREGGNGLWTCACEDCHKLQAYFDKKRAAENRRKRHMYLLIEIMCLRGRPDESKRLQAAQVEFEKIMIRKLGLKHLSSAAWYGYKVAEKAVAS